MNHIDIFRDARIRLGLSQQACADKAGLHRNTVVALESGKSIRLENFILLLKAVGIRNPEFAKAVSFWVIASCRQAGCDDCEGVNPSEAHQLGFSDLITQWASTSDADRKTISWAMKNREAMLFLRSLRRLHHED